VADELSLVIDSILLTFKRFFGCSFMPDGSAVIVDADVIVVGDSAKAFVSGISPVA